MKFGAEWKARAEEIRVLARACQAFDNTRSSNKKNDNVPLLDYKRWKKVTHMDKHDGETYIRMLEHEVARADKMYASMLRCLRAKDDRANHRPRFYLPFVLRSMFSAHLWCGQRSHEDDESDGMRATIQVVDAWSVMKEVMTLGRKTAYKMAKRADKCLPLSERCVLRWLRTIAFTKYPFLATDAQWKLVEMRAAMSMSNKQQQAISSSTHVPSEDIDKRTQGENKDVCPICLSEEAFKESGCVITRCGHAFCGSCVLDIVRRRHKQANGTLENLLKSYQQSTGFKCPMCRSGSPFDGFISFGHLRT